MKKQKTQMKKTAQDIQDEIFRKMSAEKKIRLMSEWTSFCLKLNRLNDNKKNGTRKTSHKGSPDFGQS